MPPEAEDVPGLMKELVEWIHASNGKLPDPVIAGVAHYQFETIHPFLDGNGRTGRMLTTWILYQSGYDLGKFYALEEFYSDNLQRYYDVLVTHSHHNYYFGRHEVEITSWLSYFLEGMAYVFERVGEHVKNSAELEGGKEMTALLRSLDYRARRVFGLFQTQDLIRSSEVAALLGISVRHTRDLLKGWVEDGWLDVEDPSRRARKYRLAKPYREIIR